MRNWTRFFSLNLEDWFEYNMHYDLTRIRDGDGQSKLCFGIACRMFWLKRNDLVFNANICSNNDPVLDVYHEANEYLMSIFALSSTGLSGVSSTDITVN